jgi:hypothetical protein
MSPFYSLPTKPAYDQAHETLEGGRCLLVDAGAATELDRVRAAETRTRRERWGVWALYGAQTEVLKVHRRQRPHRVATEEPHHALSFTRAPGWPLRTVMADQRDSAGDAPSLLGRRRRR